MIAVLERHIGALRHLRHEGLRHAGIPANQCPGSGRPVAVRFANEQGACTVCHHPVDVQADPTGWGGAVLVDHDRGGAL